MSPITGEDLASREIRNAKNKETIRDMRVRVLSGLKLSMQAEQTGQQNKATWSVTTEYSNVLTSKYQVSVILLYVECPDSYNIRPTVLECNSFNCIFCSTRRDC